jgi:hypothetical protein
MIAEFITKEDLKIFKKELLDELLLALKNDPKKEGQWLKSSEVRKMLNISPNTLQSYRIKGSLKFSKIGGTYFYNREDVHKMLEVKTTK